MEKVCMVVCLHLFVHEGVAGRTFMLVLITFLIYVTKQNLLKINKYLNVT